MPRPARPIAARAGALTPDTRRLTLADVAQAAKVSRTTASNAFNRPEQLSEALRQRILTTARALGYFGPNMTARALRRREVLEVGVVFHHDLGYALNDPSSIEFLRGVAKELDERHLTLQLIPKMGRKLNLEAAFQTTADILIVHAEIGPQFVPQLMSARKPIVLVDSLVPGMVSVRTEDRIGAALAMTHVLNARPDVVVVLSFRVTAAEREWTLARRQPSRSGYVGTERVAGYARAARACGFPLDRIVWIEVDDQWPETAAEHVTECRSRLPAGATLAIVAMSDRMALAAQKMVKAWRGTKVVSIVGFDDIPAAAGAGLTTIRQDHFLKGRRCVQVALDGIKPPVMPVQLVVRDT